jgi:hypothetical protein
MFEIPVVSGTFIDPPLNLLPGSCVTLVEQVTDQQFVVHIV